MFTSFIVSASAHTIFAYRRTVEICNLPEASPGLSILNPLSVGKREKNRSSCSEKLAYKSDIVHIVRLERRYKCFHINVMRGIY